MKQRVQTACNLQKWKEFIMALSILFSQATALIPSLCCRTECERRHNPLVSCSGTSQKSVKLKKRPPSRTCHRRLYTLASAFRKAKTEHKLFIESLYSMLTSLNIQFNHAQNLQFSVLPAAGEKQRCTFSSKQCAEFYR